MIQLQDKRRDENMSEIERIESEISVFKQLLSQTDYKALKHADGVITDEEYEETRQLRISYREEINRLEAELEEIKTMEGSTETE